MDPCEIWKALENTYGLGDAGGLIELTRHWTKLTGTSFRDLGTHFAMLKKLRNDINRNGQYKKDCPVLKSDRDPNRAGGPLFRTDVNTAPGAKKVQIGKVTRVSAVSVPKSMGTPDINKALEEDAPAAAARELMNESDIEMSPSSELDALELTAPGTP
ncbi:hypothetical protein ATCC90586_008128 [Pythium insidiosum]|nr:hypothetical protein ATCC90586_008128 [Pythium insidiosum]